MHLVCKLEISCHSNRGLGSAYNYIKLHGSEWKRTKADGTDNPEEEETQKQRIRHQDDPLGNTRFHIQRHW